MVIERQQEEQGAEMAMIQLEEGHKHVQREDNQSSAPHKTDSPQGSWSSAMRTMALLCASLALMGMTLFHSSPSSIPALRKALGMAIQAGIPAAGAMAVQVFALMWVRTIINFQYR